MVVEIEKTLDFHKVICQIPNGLNSKLRIKGLINPNFPDFRTQEMTTVTSIKLQLSLKSSDILHY